MDRAIDTFLADVRGILAHDGPSEQGIGRLVERMRALVHDPDVLATHEAFTQTVASGEAAAELFADTGRRSELLSTDESGLTLVRSRFDPDEPTPIHSHGTWGIVGVYAGRDRHEAWRRVDGGAEAGHAVVELIEERVLEPGDVVIIPHPPQDIHRQQGYGGEPAYEFVLFGANAMVVPRLVFDPEHESAREVVPGQR
jgi:predicted metal-dependent enzyme (double-stranded beta helix superfamily)